MRSHLKRDLGTVGSDAGRTFAIRRGGGGSASAAPEKIMNRTLNKMAKDVFQDLLEAFPPGPSYSWNSMYSKLCILAPAKSLFLKKLGKDITVPGPSIPLTAWRDLSQEM